MGSDKVYDLTWKKTTELSAGASAAVVGDKIVVLDVSDNSNPVTRTVQDIVDLVDATAVLLTSVAYGAGAGALPITASVILYTSVGGAEALTLADGAEGQQLKIVHIVDGGSGVITPTNLLAGTAITLTDAGDSVDLVFAGAQWVVIGAATLVS